MRYDSVELTLFEHSTAGNPPKKLAGQTVEIVHEPDTVVTSVDGKISTGRHPSRIVWTQGKARDLAAITNVRIVASNGDVLIDDWEVNRTFEAPRDAAKGVLFFVFR